MITTQAWVLRAGPDHGPDESPAPGRLELETMTLPDLEPDEVLVEPLYGSWEANVDHALSRSPVDVCRQRGEDRVVLVNVGVVRVLRPGASATSVKEGDICLIMPFTHKDRFGYVELVYAYDAPGTVGLLAKRTKLKEHLLLPVPEHSDWPLTRWAAYGRYFTAWDNWRVAEACWRSQVGDDDPADHLVFSWGGGVGLAELDLARRSGFKVAMTASTDHRLSLLAKLGITPVDRRSFPNLDHDPDRARTDRDRLEAYRDSERCFLDLVSELSDGGGVSIFVDNIGAPLQKATLKALSRQGVLTTCGWKHGMRMANLRAVECISRHLHVHTHVWRYQDCARIRDFQESTGWIADVEQIYPYDRVPELARAYSNGEIKGYFPVFQVNPE